MSLIRLAIRLAAVQAIKGATFAEGRVFDSAISPLDVLIKTEPKPFISVTTDDDDSNVIGRDLYSSESRNLDLIIEVAIAGKTQSGQIEIPHTDAGLDLSIDIIQRQIIRALMAGETVWSDAFKLLVPRIHRISARRGAAADTGIRFAARQIILSVDTVSEPEPGVALDADHALKTMADLMTASGDAELAVVASLILAEVKGADIPSWDRVKNDLGISSGTARGIGLGPYILETDLVEGDPAELSEITVTDENTADDTIVDADNAEGQDPTPGIEDPA